METTETRKGPAWPLTVAVLTVLPLAYCFAHQAKPSDIFLMSPMGFLGTWISSWLLSVAGATIGALIWWFTKKRFALPSAMVVGCAAFVLLFIVTDRMVKADRKRAEQEKLVGALLMQSEQLRLDVAQLMKHTNGVVVPAINSLNNEVSELKKQAAK